MPYRILDDCIICNRCAPRCPVEAISLGDDIYEIDENKCVECKGYHDEPQCFTICPVDVIIHVEKNEAD